MTPRPLLYLVLLMASVLPILTPARATEADAWKQMIFVAEADRPALTILDSRTDQVVGQIELPMTADRIQVSPVTPILIASKASADAVALVDLVSNRVNTIHLDFPATHLIIAADGGKAAVFDDRHLAILALPDGGRLRQITTGAPLRDALFGRDGASLLMAAEPPEGLTSLDIGSGAVTGLDTFPATDGPHATALVRSPNGRSVFTVPSRGGVIGLIGDTTARRTVDTGAGDIVLTTSGTGAYLLATHAEKQSLSIIHGDDFSFGATLLAQTGIGTAYSGWFDSVAFLPSTLEKRVLVYDLWKLARLKDIDLPASAGPGTVTSDGAKLYLPLPGARAIAVIDTRFRRLAHLITLDATPGPVASAAGYGICH